MVKQKNVLIGGEVLGMSLTILPDIEELLFDVEDIDKYHFKKAKQIQLEISATLSRVEDTIDKLLSELQELVGSEEKIVLRSTN